MEFETRAIHDGQEPDPTTGAVITPIYQTSTYVQEAVGQHKGYDYSRVANPTRSALETALASLEGAQHGIAFASGLAATTTLMHLVDPGERVVLIGDVYGGVYRMTSQVYEPKGYRFTYVPAERVRQRSRLLPRRRRPAGLGRDAVESAAQRRRHRARRRDDTPRGCAARRRQHLRLAVPPAAARARRRPRRPLDHQVPRRPLGRGRRLRRHVRRTHWPSACASCRSRSAASRPLRRLARAARHQDARAAHAPALRERPRRRGLPRAAPGRRARLYPGLAEPSRARVGHAPDAGLRRHGLLPRRLGGARRSRSPRAHASSSWPSRSAASRA